MMDKNELHDEAEAIRAETAADAPELAEHDRVAELQRAARGGERQGALRRRRDAECPPPAGGGEAAGVGLCRDRLRPRHARRARPSRPRAEPRAGAALADEKVKSFVDGIEATLRELDAVFARQGIVRVEAMGQPLDPHKHQAMIEIATDKAEPGTIIEEMQSGYMLKDRLLRPALVAVAKAP